MIRTPFTQLVGIEHPVVSSGMGGGMADGRLAGAVSAAGGLGVIGASWLSADELAKMIGEARGLTEKPLGINLLLFGNEALVGPALEQRPAVLSTAWARDDQDLRAIFSEAHNRGIKVMHMVQSLGDAVAASQAGADVIVAQGAEGGGHVGEIATTVLVRQVVKAVVPVPVLAAGGLADGAGLAASLALGAQGVLLGTRFVASEECPVPPFYKRLIVESKGDDTVVTSVPDVLSGRDWPGAWSRVVRSPLIAEWSGREPELRRRRAEVNARLERAWEDDEPDYWRMWIGQSAGLIESVAPAGDVVRQIVADAEEILRTQLPTLLA